MHRQQWLAGLTTLLLATTTHAATLSIRPIEFGNGQTARGTITVADDTRAIIDWHLEVATVERLARYTPGNTSIKMVDQVLISGDGLRMTVATSPDSIDDGGILAFRSRNPFLDVGAWVADFSGSAVGGGQARYMSGANFDVLDLQQPSGSDFLVARAVSGDRFDLVPVQFSNGVTMWGTIVTDGRTGALDASGVVDWDIVVDAVTADVFTPANSRLSASLTSVSADGSTLTVGNPDGSLMFVKGILGGRLYALQLADFTDQSPVGGQAGYYRGRLGVDLVDLGAPAGAWSVTGADAVRGVPEPAGAVLVGMGAVMARLARRRRQRA